MKKQLLLMFVMLLGGMFTAFAEDVTYSPVLDVCFRTASGNISWQTVKSAAEEGNTDFELTYTVGFFALQKYTVENLQNASKLVLTLTVGSKSGVDAVKVWAFANNTWTASSGVDDIVPLVKAQTGIDPRATEGTANTPLVSGAKVTGSDPAKATFTISGTALATIKANASEDGTFTLLLTNDKLLDTGNKRSYLSNNTANDEANRPTLVATIEKPSVTNTTTGVSYNSLTEAFNAAVTADADAHLVLNADQTLTSRLTWNVAHKLTITASTPVIIKGHRNGMWFLANVDDAELAIGSTGNPIYFDGQDNTMEYDVTKCEKKSKLTLTNVSFQNFDLNNKGHLVGSNNAENLTTLEYVTISNCKNPSDAFIYKARVTNDRLVLKGYLDVISNSEGTTIYAASETKTSGTTGRIKIDDSTFSPHSDITINWPETKAAGIVVVIGTTADNAARFKLTDEEWTLERKTNGDLVMAVPATPTAKIGDTNYADLTEALAAVQDGETITLLDDQEVSSRINVKNMSITIDGAGKTIKRKTGYTNGMLFLTQTADEGKTTSLTLENVTIDGQNIEATAAVMEAGNYATTILNNVTFKNCKNTHATNVDASIVVNKSGGVLEMNGVTFTDCSSTKPIVFVGTGNVTLKGENTIAEIFVENNWKMKADGATATAPITLVTNDARTYTMIVEGGDATQFACTSFRLSQQVDGVYCMPAVVANAYTHPGLLHTADDINRVKGYLTAGEQLFTDAYAALETASAGVAAGASETLKRMDKTNWEATYADYNNFTHAANDAKLAYELALRYKLKGNSACATSAVNILKDWATNCKGVLRLTTGNYANNIPDPNEYLICIQGYQFANAAELLSDYEGWDAADKTAFNTWIKQTFADLAITFLENHHNQTNVKHYWANWDLAALSALVSIGVLTDDKALVDYALNYADNGEGTGSKANATVATHEDADSDETLAQCQESGRDQGHSTLDVSLLGVLCQTAKNQGTDLFTGYKALEMAEYVGKYNLMDAETDAFVYDNVPFTEYNNGETTHTAISSDARGTIRPCWELFHAYARANDKGDKYTEEWVKYMRAKNNYGEGASDTNDELGFGTLMFASKNDLTGIINVNADENVNADGSAVIYDLQGRKVSGTLTKGIYIINGKKVIKK